MYVTAVSFYRQPLQSQSFIPSYPEDSLLLSQMSHLILIVPTSLP